MADDKKSSGFFDYISSSVKGTIRAGLIMGTVTTLAVYLYSLHRTGRHDRSVKECSKTLVKIWTPNFVNEMIRAKESIDIDADGDSGKDSEDIDDGAIQKYKYNVGLKKVRATWTKEPWLNL